MILTVTPNPSLDLLFRADRLVWDDANRIPQPRRRPGGQGINVVRAVRALDPGASTLAIALLGGPTGHELRQRLDAEGTPLRSVPVGGETRVFVGTRETATGRSLLLNPRGPNVSSEEAEALLAAIAEALELDSESGLENPGSRPWVLACGSVPPGVPTDFYAAIGRLAHGHGARFIPDCDGPALAAAAPLADLLVPNDMEAARLADRPVESAGAAVAAGRAFLESAGARSRPRPPDHRRTGHGGPDRVVITLGSQGAVAVTKGQAWWARPELPGALAAEAAEGSAVGAGDAFLAALLLFETEDEPARLARAVAAGTAVLLGRGTTLVDPEDVERVLPHVTVERQDP